MIVTTSFLVLDKHPCRETALLLRGISPDYGKMALMLHRAENAEGIVADKYRELEIEFKDDVKGDVYTADRAETIASFEKVADSVRHFAMAEKIGAFLLKNLSDGLPQPYTYDTVRSVLSQLAERSETSWTLEQCAVVVKCTFLYENGLLPEGCTPQQSEFLENLVAAGIDNSALPRCAESYWHSLNLWLNSLLDYQQLAR
ncbi:MAG: hypothetical protein MJ016_03340 [Victivallaceae bacterium]|nr:hypothetical protein [Victivallaceae bacterium]